MSMIPMTGYKLAPSYQANLENINYHVSMGATAEAVAEKYEITLIIKQKRAQSPVVSPSFPALLKKLANNRRFNVLNTNVSPIEIIKKTRGTIAMPFTSPALIAKQFDKPSIFYDASGRISQKDVGGVPVATSLISLRAWVELVLKSPSINHNVRGIE